MNPRPRSLLIRSVLVFTSLVAALAVRSPRPVEKIPSDLRDSIGEHRALLSKGHASFSCGACHFAHPAKAARPLWQTSGGGDAALFVRDSAAAGGVQTGLCMSCHDGTIAPTITAHMTSSGGADLGANHPVGIDYLSAARNDPASFIDPASNPRIVLEDGKVACISCHAAHDIGSISGGSVRQEVCVECHRR
ncbi:MAG: hypothetical protein NUW21_07635 [Elusimicrobia bacterium]|nr:hypothetical protein [Elusimicrobiota bacterium]